MEGRHARKEGRKEGRTIGRKVIKEGRKDRKKAVRWRDKTGGAQLRKAQLRK